MSDEPNQFFNHAEHSVGGLSGHILRRITHVSIILIPILFYGKGKEIASFFNLEPNQLVISVCLIFMIFEFIRLKLGFIDLFWFFSGRFPNASTRINGGVDSSHGRIF